MICATSSVPKVQHRWCRWHVGLVKQVAQWRRKLAMTKVRFTRFVFIMFIVVTILDVGCFVSSLYQRAHDQRKTVGSARHFRASFK